MKKKQLESYLDFKKDLLTNNDIFRGGVEYQFDDITKTVKVTATQIDGEEYQDTDYQIFEKFERLIELEVDKGELQGDRVYCFFADNLLDGMEIHKDKAAALLSLKRIANTRYKMQITNPIADRKTLEIFNILNMDFVIKGKSIKIYYRGMHDIDLLDFF